MRLDAELLKEVLIWCEKNTPSENKSYLASEIELEKFAPFQVMFHVKLLYENGYLDANDASAGNHNQYILNNLTLAGYELLNLMRNDTIGKKIKKQISELGLKAFPILLQTAIKIIGDSMN
jgi:hypothetical protein